MILDEYIKQKRFFNINDKKDIAIAKKFFKEYAWGIESCPFILEFPYLTIPDMLKDKMIHKFLNLKYDRKHHWG
jgi:hypothetical protein